MSRDQQLKTLSNPKASKEQIREALAAALGVAYERPGKEKAVTLFTQCRDMFMEVYKKDIGVDYPFEAKDGVALSSLIKKIDCLSNTVENETLDTFKALMCNLPKWYKDNGYTLSRINGNFPAIIANIRTNGGQTGITKDFGARTAERIRARNAGSQP